MGQRTGRKVSYRLVINGSSDVAAILYVSCAILHELANSLCSLFLQRKKKGARGVYPQPSRVLGVHCTTLIKLAHQNCWILMKIEGGCFTCTWVAEGKIRTRCKT